MPKINFLLESESFVQGTVTTEELKRNLYELYNIKKEIDSSNDLLFKDNNLFLVHFFNSKTIYEVLHTLNHDIQTLLIEILKAKNLNSEVCKLVGLNKIGTSNTIYTFEELISYYKYYIENLIDKDEFVERINKFFKRINFSDNIRDSLNSLDGKLEDFNYVIINILICLEKEYEICMKDANNETITALKMFSTKLGLETTNEGDVSRKKYFTFNFKNKTEENKICCEPHIKMCTSKVLGDTKHYVNRIHFHSNHEDFENKILVGHIGGHL